MIELDQMKLELQQYETPLEEVRDSLDLDYKKQRIEELSRESEAPDFWNDADTANKKMKQLKDLQTLVEDADQLSTSYEDMMMLIEMGNEEDDRSVIETTSMTIPTPSSALTPEQAAQRAATGVQCSTECIRAGRTERDLRLTS